jgi:protein-disulfide isomerase
MRSWGESTKTKTGYYGFMTRQIFAAALLALSVTAKAQTIPSGRSIGPIVAKVTVDVYSDFQCPHCKALAEQTLPRVKDEYALKDKIRLVHHDFPLSMHSYAKQAAVFAAAADRVGKFEQVSEVLFRQQDTWGANGKVEEVVDSVLTEAEAKKVHDLVKDPSVTAVVQRDIDLGTRLNITSTPTIIVTKNLKSERVVGFVTYAILARYLDQQLSQ